MLGNFQFLIFNLRHSVRPLGHHMAGLWWLARSAEFWYLVSFHFFILAMLVLDLGLFQRRAHSVRMTEAAIWSTVWIALALLFAFGIWKFWHLWHDQDHDR